MHAPDPNPPSKPAHRSTAQGAAAALLRGVGWLGHWLLGAVLALLIGAGIAGWIWAGQDGSLPRALSWAQAWLDDPACAGGRLQAGAAQGSLRRGGKVQDLQWSRQGLNVQLHGLSLRWSSAQLVDLLLWRRLQIEQLHIDRLRIDDQRAPQPAEPMQAVELPLPIELPWSLGTLELAGRQPLKLGEVRGHYRYRPVEPGDRQGWGAGHPAVTEAHYLRIDSVTVAQGQYQLEATVGAQSPMPLHAASVGRVQAAVPEGERLDLQAAASASGTLAGASATLDVQAHVLPVGAEGTPTLTATARLMPAADQPVQQIDARAHALDLALLWPQAPVTSLSGLVQAAPESAAWRARLDLRNTRSGPWDRQRLPLDRLQATVEQDGALWRVTRLEAALGPGRVQGTGLYRNAADGQPLQWAGDLQGDSIDPARLWSTLPTARWTLRASARQQAEQADTVDMDVRLQASSDAARMAGPRLRDLRLLGRWRAATGGGVLDVEEARLDAAQAQLEARGVLDLGKQRFDGNAALQLPGARGRLDGALARADGQGSLTLDLEATDRLLDWLRGLRDTPLIGTRVAGFLAQAPLLDQGALSGQARLQAQWQGGLAPLGYPAARDGDARPVAPLQAQVTLEVPRLSASLPAGSGSWTLRDLRVQATGGAADLALQLRGEVGQGPWSASWQTQGRARGLWPWPAVDGTAATLSLDTLDLRATDTTRTDRTMDWALRSTVPIRLSARGTGDALTVQTAPAQLQLQPQVRWSAATPRPSPTAMTGPLLLSWDSLAWQAGVLQSRGRLGGLPLAWADVLARAENALAGPLTQAGVGGDLLFDGEWDLALPLRTGARPRLDARLQRRSGDLLLRTDGGETPSASGERLLAGGVRDARLGLTVGDGGLEARLRWDSERLGQISANLNAPVADGSAGEGQLLDRWWPASTPLQGTLSARLPQVGVWSALAPPGWRMRGTLQLDATVAGTRATPDWRGTLQADQLALRSVVDGFEFTQGMLRASLSGERITIDRFELQGPLGGSLSARGQAQWPQVEGRRQPQIELQVSARQLRVSDRPDRRLTLSGQADAQLSGPRLVLRGQLKADSALFVLPDETTPSLSADVVVRGGRNLPQGTGTVAQVQPDVSVQLDLGPQFDVRGRGLQARLTGQLQLRSTPALPAPRVYGVVRTASGSYRAYGQRLTIETGELSFNGPYDDPALNVLAIRPMARDTEQRVGVQISGSAQDPRVRLVATPDLPDAEKLAWLVLGRPATGAGAEAAILQQAALALLAGNDSTLNSGLAGALGLDEISYRGESLNADGTTRAAAVTLGKRISNELYLSYETGLAGAMGTVSVFYDISRHFTLRARAGDENAVDLIFTWPYD